MKRAIFALLILSSAQPAQAQLFRRLFGGRERVQIQQQCVQQQAYYQPVQYQQAIVVAAVPLVPVAIDSQAFIYSVNAEAFQNFRQYQEKKSQQGQSEAVPAGPRSTVTSLAASGADVLKASCIQCHQAGRAPKAGFAIFDESGQLASNLPLQEMLSRMTSDDPQERMPPKSQLANHDILAVMRLAVEGVQPRPVQTATNDEPASPF